MARVTGLIQPFVVEQRVGQRKPTKDERFLQLIGQYNDWRRKHGDVCRDPRNLVINSEDGHATVMYDEVIDGDPLGFSEYFSP